MINKRSTTVIAGAMTVNLMLFIIMERMSSQPPVILSGDKPPLSVDFVRLKRTPPPPSIKQRVTPPEKREQPVTTPTLDVPSPKPIRVQDMTVKTPRLDLAMNISGVPFRGEMGSGDLGALREAVPLVRIPPLYPPNALSRRIEGRVKIVFTVAEDGTVVDPVVVEAKPEGIFNSAALRAIRKWKFNKRLVDGRPVQWQTVQTIIFQMEKS